MTMPQRLDVDIIFDMFLKASMLKSPNHREIELAYAKIALEAYAIDKQLQAIGTLMAIGNQYNDRHVSKDKFIAIDVSDIDEYIAELQAELSKLKGKP